MSKRTEAEPEMVTTTVAFERATYKALRHLAVEEDTNVRDLIRRAVEEYLRRHQKGGTTR